MKLPSAYTNMQPEGLFFIAFLEAALWSTGVNDDEDISLDEAYSFEDIDQASADISLELCRKFIALAGDMILEHNHGQGGHDLWLSISTHGSGFLDGDWPVHGIALTAIAESLACYAYATDDGETVYIDYSIPTKEEEKSC